MTALEMCIMTQHNAATQGTQQERDIIFYKEELLLIHKPIKLGDGRGEVNPRHYQWSLVVTKRLREW